MPAKKANGEGSISYDTSRERYRAAFTAPDGSRFYKRFKTKKEAQEWLTVKRSEILQGTFIYPSDVKLGEWLSDYLRVYCVGRVRPQTIIYYTNLAKHLAPIANKQLNSLNAIQIEKFYNTLPAELSSSSKSQVHKLLKAAVTKAYLLEIIPKNFMELVHPIKVERKEVQIFTDDEIRQILAFLQSNTVYKSYYTLVALAIATGARLGEILGLKNKSVYDNYIYIENSLQRIAGKEVDVQPKTEKSKRRITISKDMIAALWRISARLGGDTSEPEQYVFHTRNLTPYCASSIQQVWRNILKYAQIPYRKFHCLRHTHATRLLAEGVPLIEVSRRLGHATPTMTLNIYGHAMVDYDDGIPDIVTKTFGV